MRACSDREPYGAVRLCRERAESRTAFQSDSRAVGARSGESLLALHNVELAISQLDVVAP